MKLVKTASGKQTVKISKKEWEAIGKKASWDNPEEVDTRFDPRLNAMDLDEMEKQLITEHLNELIAKKSELQQQIDRVNAAIENGEHDFFMSMSIIPTPQWSK